MNDDSHALANFSGLARLFPLPNVVLFPHVVQPLHVFEPRYRKLTADTLADDQLLAMALLRPGWEDEYEGRPPLYPVACLGRIAAHKRLTDGRYIILLRGLSRIRLGEEIETEQIYRTTRAELLSDVPSLSLDEARQVRERLSELVMARFSGPDEDRVQLREMLEGEVSIGPLCDHLCYRFPFPLERKQQFLEEVDVGVRARQLLEMLDGLTETLATEPRKFPPDFSVN
jgi:Lon protease-like protein